MVRMSPDVNIMVAAAEKAARALMRDFGEVEQLQISKKGPGDFVSSADKRAEDILHKELSKARPEYGFIMEEGGAIKGKDGAPIFVIDPLDGTMNFLHGIPHWCISIAIVENGKTKSGIVYAPITNELFYAEAGEGAYMGKKRLRVSGRNKFDASAIAIGEALPHMRWYEQSLEQANALRKQNVSIRRFGAAALELCYVASGRLEAYWETGIKVWDVAAGILILEEARGKVTSLNADNADPMTSQSILASNGVLHDDLQALIGYVKQ
ncbi:MAG: inositol monophosphatase [Alphaproteobacteria bacterium]|nr:inositol monophosphatase [Alphaproteobacteria bacterium]